MAPSWVRDAGARTLATAAGSGTASFRSDQTATIADVRPPPPRPALSPSRRSRAPCAAGAAQDVGAAVADLRDHDVTFEEGAVDDRDLGELDAIAAALDDDGTDFKIVVLADPVGDEFSSTRDFAEQVLDGLGGDRRVVVYDPGDVGIASSVDPPDEIEHGRAGRDRRRQQLELLRRRRPGGCRGAAARAMRDARRAAADGDDGGGFPWGVVLLLLVVVALVVLVVVGLLRRPRAAPRHAAERAGVQGAEATVREVIDRISRRVLDLADRAQGRRAGGGRAAVRGGLGRLPRPPGRPGGGRHPLGARGRVAADRRRRLASSRPRRRCSTAARAPRRPSPTPLFPAPVAPVAARGPRPGPGRPAGARPGRPAPPPAQDRGYRGFDVSPWLTQAAIAAVTMLAEPARTLDAAAPRADGRRRLRRHLRRPRAGVVVGWRRRRWRVARASAHPHRRACGGGGRGRGMGRRR